MPLYEYQCQQCHRRTEKIQKFSDPELTTCPHCGGTLERTLTAPAIQFKGSGWYKDLYSSAKPAASSGEGAAAGHSEGAETASAPNKSDAAPAAAPAASASSAAPSSPSPSSTPSST